MVGPWHLPVTPAASRRVGLLDTRWGRVGAGSLPHPAGAASGILSVRLSISLASINMVSIEVAFVVDAASAIVTCASGMDSGTASAVAGGVDIRGGTQAITIPIGGGIPHLMIMTRTTSDS